MGRTAAVFVAVLAVSGCQAHQRAAVPGDTEIGVREVRIEAAGGGPIGVETKPLLETLGLRAGTLIRPERGFNPYRLAEDRRRIAAYLQARGRFDVKVAEPVLERHDGAVTVTWKVTEGPVYQIGSVDIVNSPNGTRAMLEAMVPFGAGDPVAVDRYRPLRRRMAERLQDQGFGHARVYSRAYVDRSSRKVGWYYFVDAGPRTHVGSISVAGANKVSEQFIRERIGLRRGDPYSTAAKRRAELALLDSGAFRSVSIVTSADILDGPPEYPETGGAKGRIDANGELVPRDLDPRIDLRVVVVEAPSRQLRLEAGVEADPARADAFAGARALFRHLLGGENSAIAEGSVGYGWRIGDAEHPTGVYGEALLRLVHPGVIGRKVDLTLSGRFRHRLLPGAAVRELTAGPGLRTTAADGVYLDLEVLARRDTALDFPDFDMATASELSLPADPEATGAEVAARAIVDRRDDRIEPHAGRMLEAAATYAPGGPLGTHRYLSLTGDARQLFRLTPAWSLGLRASGGVIASHGESGVPLSARFFGGGAYGFRGLGRQELSPSACAAGSADMSCDETLVGGLSLFESSIEARYLPFRKLYGAAAFVDLGGAGAARDPFADGLSTAVGFGLRLRSWYVPVALDLGYRILDAGELEGPGQLSHYSLSFRIGEAF